MAENKPAIIIPQKHLCAACCEASPYKCNIFTKTGKKGDGYDIFVSFFDYHVKAVKENWPTYLCRPCRTMIDKWNHCQRETARIKTMITAKCQHISEENQQILSPDSPPSSAAHLPSKRPCLENISVMESTLPATGDLLSTSLETNNFACALNTVHAGGCKSNAALPCTSKQPFVSVPLNTRSRHGTVLYKTCGLKDKLESTVQSLANGSVFKTLRQIHKYYPSQVKEFIVEVVQHECRKFNRLANSEALRTNSPSELQNFNLKTVDKEIKHHAPTFWAVINAAAENRTRKVKQSHVTIASLVLLKSRSNQLSAVQYLAGILSYHHCMQKEGIHFLHSVGLSVSPTSLQNKLKSAQEINDNRILEWKTAIANQNMGDCADLASTPTLAVSSVANAEGGVTDAAVHDPAQQDNTTMSTSVYHFEDSSGASSCIQATPAEVDITPIDPVSTGINQCVQSSAACNMLQEATGISQCVQSLPACNIPPEATGISQCVQSSAACNISPEATGISQCVQSSAACNIPPEATGISQCVQSSAACNIPPEAPATDDLHPGMSLIIDNFDVEVKARNMTMDNRDQSKHYVQVMAVLDRVNVEHIPLQDTNPVPLTAFPNSHFLPNEDDVRTMRDDFVHAMSLILVDQVPAFKDAFSGILEGGFTHQHSIAMSKKSVVLPLGIHDKSENITDELTELMRELHTLVPGARPREVIDQVDDRDPSYALLRPLPVGGDQLTQERIRAMHQSLILHNTPEERLQGLLGHIEDFHEKMNNLDLIMQKFYNTQSAQEGGTLYYLRNLIERTNVSKDVRQHYHEVADFVDLVTECHVVAAAMSHLDMESVDTHPKMFPADIKDWNKEDKAAFLKQVVCAIADKFIYHQLVEDVDNLQATIDTGNQHEQDHILNYAANFMTHGLIRKVTKMTTAAGDGDRAVRNWKYALLTYNTTNKIKYRLEAFLFLASVSCLLPPRLREQIKWCRFVNVSGGQFRNVDGDEAMEMMNNLARKQVKMLGSNHTPKLVMRIGKTIQFTSDIAKNTGQQVGVPPISRNHTSPSLARDRTNLLLELTQRARVFHLRPGRSHPSFHNQPASIFGNVDAGKLHKWLTVNRKRFARGRWAF